MSESKHTAGIWEFIELVARGNTEMAVLEAMADELMEQKAQRAQARGSGTHARGPSYPKKCDLCGLMIESADDFDWHGYGNCVEITDEMWAEWEREAKAEAAIRKAQGE